MQLQYKTENKRKWDRNQSITTNYDVEQARVFQRKLPWARNNAWVNRGNSPVGMEQTHQLQERG